jgi:hypothetical protein
MAQHLAITPGRIRIALASLENSGLAVFVDGIWKTSGDGSAIAKSIVQGEIEDLEN